MDINQILELLAPWVDVTGILGILLIIAIAARKFVKKATAALNNFAKSGIVNDKKLEETINKKFDEGYKKALVVKVLPLVESELTKIQELFSKALLEYEKKTAQKTDALITAVASMRSLSTDQREKLLALVDKENKDPECETILAEYEVSQSVSKIAEAIESEPEETFDPDVI